MIDRIGRKKSYAAGSLIIALVLAYLFSEGLSTVYLSPHPCHGVGFAICITAAFTYIASIVPKSA